MQVYSTSQFNPFLFLPILITLLGSYLTINCSLFHSMSAKYCTKFGTWYCLRDLGLLFPYGTGTKAHLWHLNNILPPHPTFMQCITSHKTRKSRN